MLTFSSRLLLTVGAVFFLNSALIAPHFRAPDERERLILVDLGIDSPDDAEYCYSSKFDRKKVEIAVEMDDPILFLEDFVLEEDPLEGPGCFFPEMKIIFKDYTYVVSLYCTEAHKYKNSAPYIPSKLKYKEGLEVTESMLELLKKLQSSHFGMRMNKALADKYLVPNSLKVDLLEDEHLLHEEEDDHSDLLRDAMDEEGWFDHHDSDDSEIKAPADDDE